VVEQVVRGADGSIGRFNRQAGSLQRQYYDLWFGAPVTPSVLSSSGPDRLRVLWNAGEAAPEPGFADAACTTPVASATCGVSRHMVTAVQTEVNAERCAVESRYAQLDQTAAEQLYSSVEGLCSAAGPGDPEAPVYPAARAAQFPHYVVGHAARFGAGRLSKIALINSDGSRVLGKLYDDALKATCGPILFRPNDWRCYPEQGVAGVAFLDAECTQKVVVVRPGTLEAEACFTGAVAAVQFPYEVDNTIPQDSVNVVLAGARLSGPTEVYVDYGDGLCFPDFDPAVPFAVASEAVVPLVQLTRD
jgi:hypothetical protein